MFGEDETPDPKFHGFYDGVVVDNRDPLRVGRVRVRIPGLVEPFSSWALPMANPGGGSDSRQCWGSRAGTRARSGLAASQARAQHSRRSFPPPRPRSRLKAANNTTAC